MPGCSTTVSPPICPCLSGWLAGCVSGCPPPPQDWKWGVAVPSGCGAHGEEARTLRDPLMPN